MRRYSLAAAGLLIGFAAPAIAQEKVGTCDGPRDACQQVAALIRSYDEAFNRKDAAAVAAIFTPDGIEITEAPVVSGREAIEQHYRDAFKAGWSDVMVNVDQFHVKDDMTWGVGDWHANAPGPGNTTRLAHGNWGAIWVKSGGAWKLRMLTNNAIENPAQ
jgi:uncharacterized protein (TIGR02246 family)